MNWRTAARLVMAHVIASYASMVALDVLALEIDGGAFAPFIQVTIGAPVTAPLIVLGIAVGNSRWKPLTAAVLVTSYSVAQLIIWQPWRLRPSPRGFPVLPRGTDQREPPR